MPDMDGFELAELMRGSERTRHVPIIFVTAGARDQHRVFKGYESRRGRLPLQADRAAHPDATRPRCSSSSTARSSSSRSELHERTETLRLNEMFTAVLGHDLRNPLSAILTGGACCSSCARPTTAVRETAGRMLSSGKRMSRLIEDMLDLARARLAGGIPLKREPVDLGALVAARGRRSTRRASPDRAHRRRAARATLTGDWDADGWRRSPPT